MKEVILLGLGGALCGLKKTRFIGYICTLLAIELNSKKIGYTETELCLNDIIVILLFILFEIWNKFRKEVIENENTDKRAD